MILNCDSYFKRTAVGEHNFKTLKISMLWLRHIAKQRFFFLPQSEKSVKQNNKKKKQQQKENQQ